MQKAEAHAEGGSKDVMTTADPLEPGKSLEKDVPLRTWEKAMQEETQSRMRQRMWIELQYRKKARQTRVCDKTEQGEVSDHAEQPELVCQDDTMTRQ